MRLFGQINSQQSTIGAGGIHQRLYRRHIIEFVAPSLMVVLVFGLAIAFTAFFENLAFVITPTIVAINWLLGGLALSFAITFIVNEWLFWYMDIWLVTEERLLDIQLLRLFKREVSELHISEVQDARADQAGIVATLLHYGNVICQTAGAKNNFTMQSVSNPEEVAGLIIDLHEKHIESVKTASKTVTTEKPKKDLGEILVRQGAITVSELSDFKEQFSSLTDEELGQALLKAGAITSNRLYEAIALQHTLPFINLADYDLDDATIGCMGVDTATKYNVIPISRTPNSVTLAIADPKLTEMSELLGQNCGLSVAFVLADPDMIREKIFTHYAMTAPSSQPVDKPFEHSGETVEF